MTWSSNEAMIEEARKQDLLIYSHYQEMWSTPWVSWHKELSCYLYLTYLC